MTVSPQKSKLLFRSQRLGALALTALLGVVSGCKTNHVADPVVGTNYRPRNVYHSFQQLPVSMRRVAVLPATCDAKPSELEHGRAVLETIIAEEMGKTKKFELVVVTPENLRAWTGKTSWRAEETLPANFLKLIREHLDCDGVMFSRLTQYRPYPPLCVGLSFKLADVENAEFVWAADEIFDASESGVVNGARRYQLAREHLPASLSDSRSILNSPSTFGRYVAFSVLQTLPTR